MRKFAEKRWLSVSVALLSLLLLFAVNVFYGSVDIPFGEVLSVLSGGDCEREVWRVIILEMRLPQALTATLAGAAISVAGLMLQTLFGNPLAGPEVLGINSGAGLGVAVVMLLTQGAMYAGDFGLTGYMALLSGAFLGAALITVVILLLSSLLRNRLFLLIAGVAVSYLASSAITVLNYFATSEGVHSYMIWGMGSFSAVSTTQLPLFAILVSVLLLLALVMTKSLNAMLLGDMYARNLGLNVKFVRSVVLSITGMLTAVVTTFCGPIAFIGLAVPHIARLFVKSGNHRLLMPCVIIVGAAVALLCNVICQLPGESGLLPLGAVTPLIGAPVIIYVILRDRSL